MGFSKQRTGRLLLAEAVMTAIPGVLAGLLLAYGYVRIIFAFLNTLWWDIVRTPVIFVRIEPRTLATGALVSLVIVLVSVLVPLRKFLNRRIAELHRKPVDRGGTRFRKFRKALAYTLITIALVLVGWQVISGQYGEPVLFFLSGGMLLSGLLIQFSLLIPGMEFAGGTEITLQGIAWRSVARNHGRSLTVVLLFALGTFMVIAIGANRQDVFSNATDPASGTGGFSHFAETAVPVLYDLNDPARRRTEGLDSAYRVIQFHKVAGDDASCLNLNRIENPPILGFDAANLSGRFSFVTHTAELDQANPWLSLKQTLPGGVIPAIADQTVIQWGLMMKMGDTLLYQTENGDTLQDQIDWRTGSFHFPGIYPDRPIPFFQPLPLSQRFIRFPDRPSRWKRRGGCGGAGQSAARQWF